MQFHILTIFPDLFSSFCASSLVQKACDRGVAAIHLTNIRDFASPPHFNVDDSPYGGGPGMVMKVEPLVSAVEAVKSQDPKTRVIFLTPTGAPFTQKRAEELAILGSLTLVCGRYEGFDQRAIDLTADEEISIGDYILMGGEVAAMVVIESVMRLVPGVLGNDSSAPHDSFAANEEGTRILEAPHYTRPPVFRDREVPKALLSGNHAVIREWRAEEARLRTDKRRPDLLRDPTRAGSQQEE